MDVGVVFIVPDVGVMVQTLQTLMKRISVTIKCGCAYLIIHKFYALFEERRVEPLGVIFFIFD